MLVRRVCFVRHLACMEQRVSVGRACFRPSHVYGAACHRVDGFMEPGKSMCNSDDSAACKWWL
jgi:hypothetical protein